MLFGDGAVFAGSGDDLVDLLLAENTAVEAQVVDRSFEGDVAGSDKHGFVGVERAGLVLDIVDIDQLTALIDSLYADHHADEQMAWPIADGLLARALELDEGRPSDDVSVLVLAVSPNERDDVRRLQLQVPIPPLYRP